MENRIAVSVAEVEQAIEARLATGQVTVAQIADLGKKLDMSNEEYCLFQERKSLASGGKLTLDEAQTVYAYLGQTVDHFNRQPVAVKVTLTKVFTELLVRNVA